MNDFTWEYTKEANFDLFGEEFSAYCTDDCEDSSNTDSMKPCYKNKHEPNHLKCLTSSTLSDESDTDGIFSLITGKNNSNSNPKQGADTNCFENECSTYDSDLDCSALTSADIITTPFFQSYSSSPHKSSQSPGSFSSKERSSASSFSQTHCNHPAPPSEIATVTSLNSSQDLLDGDDSDDAFISLYHTEMEFQELMASHTDPVGKFLKKVQLSAQEALDLNIQEQLLSAPRKPRTKYGKRKVISAEERVAINKERNREHARATRMRKRIFKEVQGVIEQHQHEAVEVLTHQRLADNQYHHQGHQGQKIKMQRVRSRSNSFHE